MLYNILLHALAAYGLLALALTAHLCWPGHNIAEGW